jgi:rare lipoprotein A
VANRLIDLSFGAARQLDMIRNGTSFVEVQVVTADSARNQPAPSVERSGKLAESLFVQVGAFGEYSNAIRLRALLNDSGIEGVVIREQRLNGRKLFRVRIGPVASVTEFDETVARVVDLGISDAHLAIE